MALNFVKTETQGLDMDQLTVPKQNLGRKRPDCKWYRSGKCIHTEHWKWCKPSDRKWFNFAKPLHAVWVDRICELENPAEPAYFKITEADIQALREGRVLTIVSPSPFFIAMMEEDDESRN